MDNRKFIGILESFISDFFDIFCQPVSPPNTIAMEVLMVQCQFFTSIINPVVASRWEVTCTGSSVEFYLDLPLSCIEDIDFMVITEPGRVAMPKGCTKIENRDEDKIVTLAPVKNHLGFVWLVVGISYQISSDKRVQRTVTVVPNTEFSQWLIFHYADVTNSNKLNN